MKKRTQLETERLLLRPFELSDAPNVREMAGDKVIADTTLNIPHPYEKGMAEEWILHRSRARDIKIRIYGILKSK